MANKLLKEVPDDIYRKTLLRCWDISLESKDTFPPNIVDWIERKRTKLGVPFAYLAYPMLSSMAYCLGKSYTEVTETYREPIIIYYVISGRSGTNKSSCVSLFRSVIEKLPTISELYDKDPLFDSGTMEGLMGSLIDNKGSVLCAVDEFGSFLDAIDKNGNGNIEKYRYLSLYSGMSWAKKTKNSGLIKIEEPRFQLTAFYQNYHLINLVLNSNHSDGFLGRFLVATPKEEYITLSEKNNSVDEIDDPISVLNIQELFNRVYEKFFKDGAIFKLNDMATKLFENYHDNDVLLVRQNDPFDEGRVSILSKSIGQVLRIAGIQCAMRICSELNETLINVSILYGSNFSNDLMLVDTESAGENVSNGMQVPQQKAENFVHVVNEDDMKRAITLTKYSVQCLFAIIDANQNTEKVGKPPKRRALYLSMPSPDTMDEDFLLLHKCKIQKLFHSVIDDQLKLSKITKNHMTPQIGGRSDSNDVNKFLKGLEKHGLGTLVESTQHSYFQIADKENISENVTNLMVKLGINNITA